MVKKKRLKISDELEENKTDCLENFNQEENNSFLSDFDKSISDQHLCNSNTSQMTPSIRTSSRVTAIKALQKLSSAKESKTSGTKSFDKNNDENKVTEENKNTHESSQNVDKIQKNKLNKKNSKTPFSEQAEKKTTKRTCEFWTLDDKLNFFDALGEHGKDFDSIQSYLALKAKKKTLSSTLAKNREQVRHFYYRTWNKISKYLEPDDSINKQILELYGLINYGELRRRTGGFLIEKNLQKLNELVISGSTIIKHKGKRIKIRTPICPALKKINNIEGSEQEEVKLPKDIYVEFRPSTNKAWLHVQNLSQNPRIRSKVPIQRRLRSLIEYLQKRWKPTSQKKREVLQKANSESLDANTVSPSFVLRVLPTKNCNVKLVKFDPFGHSMYTNISMEDYKKRCGIESKSIGSHSKTKNSSPKSTLKSLQEEKKNSPFEEGNNKAPEKEKGVDQTLSSAANDPTLHLDEVNKSLLLLNSMSESNLINIKDPLVKTVVEHEISSKNAISKNVSPSRTFSFEDIYLSNEKDMGNLTLGQILSMAEHGQQASSLSPQICPAPEKTWEKMQEVKDVPNSNSCRSQDEDLIRVTRETEEQIKGKIDNIKKGWTLKNVGLITVGELYLMLGTSDKLELEYVWEFSNDNETFNAHSPFHNNHTKIPTPSRNKDKLSIVRPSEAFHEESNIKNNVQSNVLTPQLAQSNQALENSVGKIMTTLVRFSSTLLNEQKEKLANTSSNASIQVKMNSPTTKNANIRSVSRPTTDGNTSSNSKTTTCHKASSDANTKVSSNDQPSQNPDISLEKKHKFVKPKKPPPSNSVAFAEFRKQIYQLSRRPRGRNKRLVIQRPLVPINKIGYMPEPVKVIECTPTIGSFKVEKTDVNQSTHLEMPTIEIAQNPNQTHETYPHSSSHPVLPVSLASGFPPSSISPPVISIPETSLPVTSRNPIVLFISSTTTGPNATHVSQTTSHPLETETPHNHNSTEISAPSQKEHVTCGLENVFKNIATTTSIGSETAPISEPSLTTPHHSLSTPIWTNELNDYSIGSLFDSPIKESMPLNNIMGTEVNHVVSSLLTENSNDFINKFSDLAHHVEESSSNL